MADAGFAWARVLRPVALLACGYVLIVVAARWLAERALYHPEYSSRHLPEGAVILRDPDGRDLPVLFLPNPSARFTVWFFHGNAEDLGDIEPYLQLVRDAGFSVFAAEYPGYGRAGGEPSERTLYAAARIAREHLRNTLRIPADRTILLGRSLGGGPAVQMATEERVAGLVLQSAFTSVYRVVTQRRLLPFDQFENERKLAAVACPVLVVHGEVDEVIPFSHGEALFAAAREPKRSLWLAGAAHNDVTDVAGERFWDALRAFAKLCETAGPR